MIDLFRCRNTLSRRIHDLRSAVCAIAADENIRTVLGPRELRTGALSNRDDHHVARNCFAAVGGPDLDPRDRTGSVGDDPLRSRVEAEAAAVALGKLVFVVIARHIGLAAAVHDRGCRRAEPLGLRDGVDGGVARADHHDLASDRRFAIRVRLEMLDERERVDDAAQVFAGNAQLLRAPQSDADEHRVVLRQQPVDRFDGNTRLELDPEVENVLHFRQRDVGLQLVLGNAVRIQAAGLGLCLEHRHIVSTAPQIACAREPRRPRTHDRHPFPGSLPRLEQLELFLQDIIGGVPLQQRDFDRLLVSLIGGRRITHMAA